MVYRLVICPKCKKSNNDNWPIRVNGEHVEEGGCQDCWEADVDRSWWEMVKKLDEAGLLEGE